MIEDIEPTRSFNLPFGLERWPTHNTIGPINILSKFKMTMTRGMDWLVCKIVEDVTSGEPVLLGGLLWEKQICVGE